MILQHHATLSWLGDGPFAADRVARLTVRRAGRLAVCTGRVWVTREGDLDDHVLEPGQALTVAAHEDLVIEPWQGSTTARLAWRSDQARPLAVRLLSALAAAARRWGRCLGFAAR